MYYVLLAMKNVIRLITFFLIIFLEETWNSSTQDKTIWLWEAKSSNFFAKTHVSIEPIIQINYRYFIRSIFDHLIKWIKQNNLFTYISQEKLNRNTV